MATFTKQEFKLLSKKRNRWVKELGIIENYHEITDLKIRKTLLHKMWTDIQNFSLLGQACCPMCPHIKIKFANQSERNQHYESIPTHQDALDVLIESKRKLNFQTEIAQYFSRVHSLGWVNIPDAIEGIECEITCVVSEEEYKIKEPEKRF